MIRFVLGNKYTTYDRVITQLNIPKLKAFYLADLINIVYSLLPSRRHSQLSPISLPPLMQYTGHSNHLRPIEVKKI